LPPESLVHGKNSEPDLSSATSWLCSLKLVVCTSGSHSASDFLMQEFYVVNAPCCIPEQYFNIFVATEVHRFLIGSKISKRFIDVQPGYCRRCCCPFTGLQNGTVASVACKIHLFQTHRCNLNPGAHLWESKAQPILGLLRLPSLALCFPHGWTDCCPASCCNPAMPVAR
jgi:hypothetical protein